MKKEKQNSSPASNKTSQKQKHTTNGEQWHPQRLAS
jgi:hypothetical protein